MKRLIKAVLAGAGLELRRLTPLSNPALQIARIVSDREFDLVFDVGANSGQFAGELRRIGYSGRIVSFEPLQAVHQALEAAAAGDPAWTVHSRCALGREPGISQIHVAQNSYSSSLREMNSAHSDAAPESRYVGVETIPVDTLDAVAPAYLVEARKAFLKIDTQGFELQVLEGAEAVLARIDGVLLEMSTIELYAGQALWLDLMAWMERRGFALWALPQAFVDPASMRTLQLDGVFLREDPAGAAMPGGGE